MKYKRTIKIISVLSMIVIILSVNLFAYYTNINKYFEDNRKDDGFSGLALERESNEFITDGCGSGTILDTLTGLCWLKDMNHFGIIWHWNNALDRCSTLDFAGSTNWELPKRNELITLVNQIGASGSTCNTLESFGFINCGGQYWSSTSYNYNPSHAWTVHFYDGSSNFLAKNMDYKSATCVLRN